MAKFKERHDKFLYEELFVAVGHLKFKDCSMEYFEDQEEVEVRHNNANVEISLERNCDGVILGPIGQ